MEGKEARFGPIQSALYNTATTGTSTGSVDASMDSMTPIGGLVSARAHQARRDHAR